jgi:RimJ/RimL family protein N-acetyltransferase
MDAPFSPASGLRFPLSEETFELRAPHPRDALALLEAIHESLPELKRFMLWAHFPSTLDPEFQNKRIAAAREAYLVGSDFVFHLWSGDKIVGGAGLHPRALNPRALEVGYWIRSSYSGRGLATAVVKACAVFNFEHLKNQRLQCLVNEANQASLKVAQKCGFRLEGKLKYWEAQGGEEHRAQGFEVGVFGLMHGMTVDEVEMLGWYREAVMETELLD